MKTRFALLDVNKNGVVDTEDVAIVAKNLAAYRNQGPNEEKHYFQILKTTSLIDDKGVTEEEFVERAKQFVSQPDAKEHVKALVDALFNIMDDNKDGLISYEEFMHFYKSFNVPQEAIDMIFKDVDANGDGVIDYSETYEISAKFYFST